MPIEQKQLNAVLAFLNGSRKLKHLKNRFHDLVEALTGVRLTRAQLRKAFKGNIHDHIDCFPLYYTLLTLWHVLYDFDFSKVKFPEALRAYWKSQDFEPSQVAFPAEVVSLWRGEGLAAELTGHARASALLKIRHQAARIYGKFLVDYAGGSLFQYVAAIGVHILPVMQSAKAIELIVKQRLANAKKQGERLLELRGAPQLHTWEGMSMEDAVLSYFAGIKDAEIPVRLILCALRHEDETPAIAWSVAKLACKYKTMFDLAADEKGKPGVLRSFMRAAILVLLSGGKITIHLWETNEPTDDDIRCLDAFDVMLPQVRALLKAAKLNVKDVLTSAEVEKQVAEIIDMVIARVLDTKPVDGAPDPASPVQVYNLPSGAKVACLPDFHVPASDGRIMEAVKDGLRIDCELLESQPVAGQVANRLGHGIRGRRQGTRFCEVCFSSNVVTGQVKSIAEHPGHDMWECGVAVIPCTDGTTLIGINGILDEQVLLQKQKWDAARFLICAMLCIMASSFDESEKVRMSHECIESFEALVKELAR